ncbi:OmpA family protein [Limibacter armeniacum]|uniref:OmpA family protein n=1 Tax=Limibacter armeniacum TaxID=466084 RepID=UPI002FE5A39E
MRQTSALLLLIGLVAMVGCRSALQSADRRFERGEYNTAINIYDDILKKGSLPESKQKIAYYRMGESYRLSNRLVEAMPYYKQAKDLGYVPDGVKYYYAMGLKQKGEYDKAVNLFNEYIREGQNFDLQRLARTEVKAIEEIKKLQEPDPFIFINNCASLNTSQAEYSPIYWNDQLVYTAARDTDIIYEGTGGGYTDLYLYNYMESPDSCAGTSIYLDSLVNTPGLHEASATFSKDGKTMIFARSSSAKRKEEYKEVNLYESVWNGDAWSDPVLIPISLPDQWDACPALSPNGETLYFASNRPGGYGGVDIYRATKDYKGEWGNVRNMGSKINSRGNEMFPYVSKDGKLYYSSDGLPGLGGLDLFVATRKDGKISVKNMGAPFNSPADDFGISFKDKKNGVFTSNRESDMAKGNDDIYFFEDRTPLLKPIRYFLAGTAVEKKDTTEVILANVSLQLVDEGGKIIDEVTSDEKGYFRFTPQLVMGPEYEIVSDKVNYLKDTTSYTTADKEVEQEDVKDRPEKIVDIVLETKVDLTKDFYEELIREGEITLNNIYYDFDKWDIRSDAAKELDKLVQFLRQHPEVKIELGSHTDDRGGDRYNQKLSQKRAESAVEYLTYRGIDASRLVPRGYGEEQPVIYNAQTEEEHQLNRRTTIALLEGEEIFDQY